MKSRSKRQNPRHYSSRYAPDADEDEEGSDGDDCYNEMINDVDPSPQMNGRMERRGSTGSVQTWDTRQEDRKKKKKVSLKPHKVEDLYDEQRKDPSLRKLMKKGKTANMEVRMTKGKNLVFIGDCVYIPESLRTKTMEYYFKKYKKQTPYIHLEKNCFWGEMREEMTSFETKKRRAHFTVTLETTKIKTF